MTTRKRAPRNVSTAHDTDDPKPQPPACPALEDCCQSGCNPCVFDLYDADMERYRAALQAWEQRRAARGGNGGNRDELV